MGTVQCLEQEVTVPNMIHDGIDVVAAPDPPHDLEPFLLRLVLDHVVQLLVGPQQELRLLIFPPQRLGVLHPGVDAIGAALDARGTLRARTITLRK